jgi:hypothetical protein
VSGVAAELTCLAVSKDEVRAFEPRILNGGAVRKWNVRPLPHWRVVSAAGIVPGYARVRPAETISRESMSTSSIEPPSVLGAAAVHMMENRMKIVIIVLFLESKHHTREQTPHERANIIRGSKYYSHEVG